MEFNQFSSRKSMNITLLVLCDENPIHKLGVVIHCGARQINFLHSNEHFAIISYVCRFFSISFGSFKAHTQLDEAVSTRMLRPVKHSLLLSLSLNPLKTSSSVLHLLVKSAVQPNLVRILCTCVTKFDQIYHNRIAILLQLF